MIELGSIWLRDLPTVLAGAPHGVLYVPGWETRSRSSGGFESLEGIVIHHTAEGAASDGWPSVNQQTFHDAERPNAPLHVDRKGIIYVMAAGACNTQGKGGPVLGVPLDDGNRRLIGIEQGNNGIGEAYTEALQQSILWLTVRLYQHYGTPRGWNKNADRVHHHRTYAPARKCDPTGPSRWTTNNNAGCNGADAWDLGLFRTAVSQALTGTTPPPPSEIGDDVAILVASSDGTAEQKNTWFAYSYTGIVALPTNQIRVDAVALGFVTKTLISNNQQPYRNFSAADIQALINSCWTGPRGLNPTMVGGFTIPADPVLVGMEQAKAAANVVLGEVRTKVIPVAESTNTTVQDIDGKVDDILAGGGGGSGGGLTEDQAKTIVEDVVARTSFPGGTLTVSDPPA